MAEVPFDASRRGFLGGVGALPLLNVSAGRDDAAGLPTPGAGTIGARPERRTLVRDGFLYCADPANTVIPRSWVLIAGSQIAAIGRHGEAEPAFDQVIDAAGRLVLPGFVNPHWHESFVEGPDRARPDDSDLQRTAFAGGGQIDVLTRYFGDIADAGERLGFEASLAIARWSLWTQLRSGTTLLGDTGSLADTDAMAQAAIDLGMRIRVSRWGSDLVIHPDGRAEQRAGDTERQARDWDELMRRWNHHPSGLVRSMPSVLAAFGSSDAQLQALRDVATRHDSPYAAHLAPLRNEAAILQRLFGRSAIGRFDQHGLLTDRLLAIHTAYATPAEYQRILAAQVRVCHSPANYGLLGEATVSETRMIGRLLLDGAPVSCSTDGNIAYTGGMPEAMRATHLMHNETLNDNTACPPTRALLTGTRHGAMGLGWDDAVGSIEVGKQADLVLVGIDDWRYRLSAHPLGIFLVAGGSRDVETVIVAGEVVVAGGRSTRCDERRLLEDCTRAIEAARDRVFG